MKTDKDKGLKTEEGMGNVKKKRNKSVSPKKKRTKVNRRNCDEDIMDGSGKPVNSNDCDEETDKAMPGTSSSIDDNSATSNEQNQHPSKRKNKAAVPLPRKKWKRFDSKEENEDWIPESEEDDNNLNVNPPDARHGSNLKPEESDPRLVKIGNNVWRRLEVPGDGNCDFSSIAVLSGQGVEQSGEMRQIIVNAATEELWNEDMKQQILAEHFSGPEYQDKTDDEIKQLYKTKMGTPGIYGSDLEILVAGRILPTAFSYVQLYSNPEPNQKPYRVCNVDPNSEKPRQWMFYSGDYVHGLGHYEPLEPIGHIEPLENGMYDGAESLEKTSKTIDIDCRDEIGNHNTGGLKEQLASNANQDCTCRDCKKCFKNKTTLKQHVLNVHLKDPSTGEPLPSQEWECRDCRKCLKNKTTLNQHVRNVHLKDPATGEPLPTQEWKCRDCGKCFKNKSILNNHVHDVHLKDPATGVPLPSQKWKCRDFGKYFKTKASLKHHVHEVHLKDPATGETLVSQESKCDDCEKCFKSKELLNRHVRAVHLKDPATGNLLPSKEWICTDCGKSCKTKKLLILHSRHTHAKDLVTGKVFPKETLTCPYCKKVYQTVTIKNNHIACIHHKDPTSFKDIEKGLHKCSKCHKVFPYSFSLRSHMQTWHPSSIKLRCDKCKIQFRTRSGLQNHKNKVDCAFSRTRTCYSRRYACKNNNCNRFFPSEAALQIHMSYHRRILLTNRNLGSLPPLLGLCRAQFCGTRRCGKGCPSCDHIILRREVTLGKKTFAAKNPYSCNSVGVIYAITCAHPGCKNFYVGMTVNALRTRFRQHLTSCVDGKKCKLYNHFRNVHHPADMRVEVLYQEKFDSKALWKDRLRAMEGQYIKDSDAVMSLNSVNGLLNGKVLLDS